MASSATTSTIPAAQLESFTTHLASSRRILALLGAGLSASSGLPTFRGAGGLWRNFDAVSLATPGAFSRDPALVWQFYSYRRHMALNANPNRAHLALAELARVKGRDFMTLSQNVDGLSPRAGHPSEGLKLLHGSLYDVKCWDEDGCGYLRRDDFTDPIVPALAIPTEQEAEAERRIAEQAKAGTREKVEEITARKHAAISGGGLGEANAPTARIDAGGTGEGKAVATAAKKHALIKGVDIADADVAIAKIGRKDLPQCPQCGKELLRPAVVWFGESLPEDVLEDVNAWVDQPERIDLMLVIGTSSVVYPAAGYTQIARSKGARVAVINMDKNDAKNLTKWDWFFEGDAAVIVPEILKSVVGEIGEFGKEKDASL